MVRRAHSQPGVDLTYIKQSGESDGAAGDKYNGLDQFGRVVDQRWLKTSRGTASRMQSWVADSLGNFESVTTNGTAVTRMQQPKRWSGTGSSIVTWPLSLHSRRGPGVRR